MALVDAAAHSLALRLLRLTALARRHAEARGDARAARSWAKLEDGAMGEGGRGQDVAGGGGVAGEGGLAYGCEAGEEGLDGGGALAVLLLPPCDADRVLAVCSNPGCVAFAGPSEEGRPLSRCGGACNGAVAYCCAACQRAQWVAGHQEECGGRSRER